MSGNDLKNINGDRIRVCTPEDGIPAHVTKFGTYRDNIEDAREVYLKDKERFFQIGLADRKIEMCNRDWADSAKVLFRCAIGLFRTVGATDDDRKYSQKIMDMVTKDSDLRKKNMKIHCDLILKKEPANETIRKEMRKIILDCIHDVQVCTNSQSLYIRYYESGKTFESPIHQDEVEAAREAEEMRNAIPEGCTYHPSYLYPPKPIPPGERVPDWPEPINRVMDMPVEELVYDRELGEFVVPEGYVSEDGLIDDKSVVWHPDRREVDMGFVGGERVTWKYVKHENPRDVWIPGSWEAEYQIRLYQQNLADMEPGVFRHRTEDEDEIPYYNKIPERNDQ